MDLKVTENTPTIFTERLILRRFTENDVQAVFDIYSDEKANTFLPWYTVKTIKEAEKLLQEKYLESYKRPSGYMYAVCLKDDNIPIGYVHVSDSESNDFGYGFRHEFWNKGIATEAAKAVIDRLKYAGYKYITATHDRNNPNSGKVMQKIGMTYQYSYEEQWQPKDIKVVFRMYQLNFDGNKDFVYNKYREMYPVSFIEDIDK